MYGENGSNEYILEVDVEYPNILHKLPNDYPLASQKCETDDDILSNYLGSISIKDDIKN